MVNAPKARRTRGDKRRTGGEAKEPDPYEGSPGAALVRNDDEIPEPNEPA